MAFRERLARWLPLPEEVQNPGWKRTLEYIGIAAVVTAVMLPTAERIRAILRTGAIQDKWTESAEVPANQVQQALSQVSTGLQLHFYERGGERILVTTFSSEADKAEFFRNLPRLMAIPGIAGSKLKIYAQGYQLLNTESLRGELENTFSSCWIVRDNPSATEREEVDFTPDTSDEWGDLRDLGLIGTAFSGFAVAEFLRRRKKAARESGEPETQASPSGPPPPLPAPVSSPQSTGASASYSVPAPRIDPDRSTAPSSPPFPSPPSAPLPPPISQLVDLDDLAGGALRDLVFTNGGKVTETLPQKVQELVARLRGIHESGQKGSIGMPEVLEILGVELTAEQRGYLDARFDPKDPTSSLDLTISPVSHSDGGKVRNSGRKVVIKNVNIKGQKVTIEIPEVVAGDYTLQGDALTITFTHQVIAKKIGRKSHLSSISTDGKTLTIKRDGFLERLSTPKPPKERLRNRWREAISWPLDI